MPVKFAIFSTDKSPSLNPWAYDPAPNVFIDLGEDPVHGTVDTWAGSRGRGSRIQTLGGVVDQDFGVVIQDEQIRIAVQNSPVSSATMTALENAFSASNTQYYLTDTLQCWKVRFARPGGLKIWRNLYWKSVASQNVYSYEILFNVDAEEL